MKKTLTKSLPLLALIFLFSIQVSAQQKAGKAKSKKYIPTISEQPVTESLPVVTPSSTMVIITQAEGTVDPLREAMISLVGDEEVALSNATIKLRNFQMANPEIVVVTKDKFDQIKEAAGLNATTTTEEKKNRLLEDLSGIYKMLNDIIL